MTDVIGLDLEEAQALLKKEGIPCRPEETRSKKGIEQGRPYVVRCRETPEGAVLTWACFTNEI